MGEIFDTTRRRSRATERQDQGSKLHVVATDRVIAAICRYHISNRLSLTTANKADTVADQDPSVEARHGLRLALNDKADSNQDGVGRIHAHDLARMI